MQKSQRFNERVQIAKAPEAGVPPPRQAGKNRLGECRI
jgi:hypothetical protein